MPEGISGENRDGLERILSALEAERPTLTGFAAGYAESLTADLIRLLGVPLLALAE